VGLDLVQEVDPLDPLVENPCEGHLVLVGVDPGVETGVEVGDDLCRPVALGARSGLPSIGEAEV
jgi:predicted RNase H-like nuclease (RuvC/YqgF family)